MTKIVSMLLNIAVHLLLSNKMNVSVMFN